MSGSAIVDLRDTYGAAFIGLIISTALYGVTVTQTWIYYWHYRSRDPMILKGFITFLFILDTLQTVLCSHCLYWYLILNFGNVASLDFALWSLNVQLTIDAIIGYLVQLFYARRVFLMSNKNIVIPAIIVVLGGICCGLGFVSDAKSFTLKHFSRFSPMKWIACLGMSTAAAADLLIALAMCWYLYNRKTGFSRTDSMITTLMSYSINTGLLTGILATFALLIFVLKPTTLYAEATFWVMGKCYVNSLLAMLNSRDAVWERSISTDHPSHGLQMPSVRQSRFPHTHKTGPTAVSVSVHSTAAAEFTTGKFAYDNEQESNKSVPVVNDE